MESDVRKLLATPVDYTSRPFLMALAALGLTLALGTAATHPPPALDVSAPTGVFSAGRAMEVLSGLLEEDQPHPIGSAANQVVRDRILRLLTELGYRPRLQRDAICREDGATCAVTENILARLDGRENSKSVLLSAHYDSVGAGPGAGDDGSGVAAILEIARILKADPTPRNPILFLINDGEEAGLLGAESFVRFDPRAAEVGAVVNLEARGTSGRNWMFETSADGLWLVQAYARSVARPATSSIAYSVYRRLPNDTDLTVYKRAGLEGLGLAFLGDVQRYHTPLDDVPRLSPEALQLQGDAGLALARELASVDFERVERGEAVFFDVFGRWTLWWPQGWTVWMAAAGVLLWVALALVTGLKKRLPARKFLRAWLCWPLALALAGGLGYLLGKLLDAAGAFPSPFVSQPGAAIAAFWGIGLASVLGSSAWLTGKSDAWSLWMANLFWWTAASAVCSVLEPAVAYPYLLPALGAGLASWVWLGSRSTGWLAGLPGLIPAVLAGALLFPMMAAFYDALGRVSLPAISLLAGLAATWLVPLAARAPGRLRYGVPITLFAGAALFALVAGFAPAYSASLPRHVNIRYQAEPDRRRWIVLARPEPETLGGVVLTRERVYPWSDLELPMAEAPTIALPAPTVEVVRQWTVDGEELTEVRIRSPRGASVLDLTLPEAAVVREVIYPDFPPLSPNTPPVRKAWRRWRFLTVPPGGVEAVIVRTAGSGDAGSPSGFVTDYTSGLPGERADLLQARGAAVPSGEGDLTVVIAAFP